MLGVPGALAVAGLVEAVLARDPTLTLRRFDEVFASGQDLLALALEFLKHLRDLMIVKLCRTRDVLVDASDSEFELLTQQASGVDSVVLAQLFDRFTRVVDALPRTRVPRLVLEMGLLDLVHSEPLVPLGDLIDRLEQISSGAPGTGGGGPRPMAPGRAAPPINAPPRSRADAPAPPNPVRSAPDDTSSSPFAKLLAPLRGGGDGPAEAPAARAVERPTTSVPAHRGAPERPPADLPGPVERGRGAANASEEPPPWEDDPSWGSADAPATRVETRSDPGVAMRRPASAVLTEPRRPSPAAAASSATATSRSAEPARSSTPPPASPAAASASAAPAKATEATSADCGGGCPGSPEPERAGVIPWASLPPMTAWEQFLDRLRNNEGPLFAMLADLGLAKLGDGVLRLAGTASDFARNHLREQAPLRAHLESLLQQHLGLPFKLELIEGEPGLPDLPSLGLIEDRRRAELQRQVEHEVQTSPQIQALKAQFNAQVRSVKPRAPQSRGL